MKRSLPFGALRPAAGTAGALRGFVSRHLPSSLLLGILLGCVGGASLLDGAREVQLLVAVAVMVPVWISTSVMRRARILGAAGLALIALQICVLGVFLLSGHRVGGYLLSAVGGAFYALTSVQLLSHAFGRDRDAFGRLLDGVNAYLIVGFTYVDLYAVVDHVAAGAFLHGQGRGPLPWGKLVYFSFSTLTTTGYGDIAPQHPLVRGLASVEQISGVFFTAGLVGRILGLATVSPGGASQPPRPSLPHADDRA